MEGTLGPDRLPDALAPAAPAGSGSPAGVPGPACRRGCDARADGEGRRVRHARRERRRAVETAAGRRARSHARRPWRPDQDVGGARLPQATIVSAFAPDAPTLT
jgi:hypothetical protein